MPKKNETVKPLFPLKHEFYATLDKFAQEAGMLADAVKTALDHDAVSNTAVCDILRKRLDAFRKVRFGDGDGDEE
jgi:hypothetical protein